MTDVLCAAREAHPFWGARKLLAVQQTKHPRVSEWPAPSTVADLLARRGLVQRRRTRRASTHPGVVPASADAIRTDNGVPFATAAIHGLSFLNVYWMQLGIVHQRIRPSSLQEKGAHERMHRTLKRHAIKPVRHTCAAQQRNVDAFRHEYNDKRPHEALGQTTPASHYRASRRSYRSQLPVPEYPGHYLVKMVTTAGTFRFGKRLAYLANALTNRRIGLEETDDGCWSIYFHRVLLATFDERDYIIQS